MLCTCIATPVLDASLKMSTSKIATPAVLAAFERVKPIQYLPKPTLSFFSLERLVPFNITTFLTSAASAAECPPQPINKTTILDEDRHAQPVPVLPTPCFDRKTREAHFISDNTTIASVIRNQRMLHDFKWLGSAVQLESSPLPTQPPASITLPFSAPVQPAEISDEEHEKVANDVFFDANSNQDKEELETKENKQEEVPDSGEASDDSSSWLTAKTPSTGSEVASKTDGLNDLNDVLLDTGSWLGCNKTPGSAGDKAASKVDKVAYLDDCLADTGLFAPEDDNKTEPFPEFVDCACSSCNGNQPPSCGHRDSGYSTASATARIFAKLAAQTEQMQLQREALTLPVVDLAPGYTHMDLARDYRSRKLMAQNEKFIQGIIRSWFLSNGHRLSRSSKQRTEIAVRLTKTSAGLLSTAAAMPEPTLPVLPEEPKKLNVVVQPTSPPNTPPSRTGRVFRACMIGQDRLDDIAFSRAESALQKAKAANVAGRVQADSPLSFGRGSYGDSTSSEVMTAVEGDAFAPLPGSRPETVMRGARKGAFRALLNENPDVECCILNNINVTANSRNRYNVSPIREEGQKKVPDSFREFRRQRQAKLSAMRGRVAQCPEQAKTVEGPRRIGAKRSRFQGIFEQMKNREAGGNVSERLARNGDASGQLGILMGA